MINTDGRQTIANAQAAEFFLSALTHEEATAMGILMDPEDKAKLRKALDESDEPSDAISSAVASNPSNPHDTDAVVEVEVRIRLPRSDASAYLAASTGNDDDVLLAAERAIRQRIDSEEVELSYLDSERTVTRFLSLEADVERHSRRLYGPRVNESDLDGYLAAGYSLSEARELIASNES